MADKRHITVRPIVREFLERVALPGESPGRALERLLLYGLNKEEKALRDQHLWSREQREPVEAAS